MLKTALLTHDEELLRCIIMQKDAFHRLDARYKISFWRPRDFDLIFARKWQLNTAPAALGAGFIAEIRSAQTIHPLLGLCRKFYGREENASGVRA